MSLGRLIYHGTGSDYYGAMVVYPLVQATTKRNVSLTSVVGVNGSYINDNLSYTDITQQITFVVQRPTFYKDWFTWGMDFGDWLTCKDKFVKYERSQRFFSGWNLYVRDRWQTKKVLTNRRDTGRFYRCG